MSWTPLYPFGYGLSYTNFEYRGLKLNKDKIAAGETVTASVTVANVGNRAGVAVPQLYIRDLVACCVRPVKELKGFQKLFIKAGVIVSLIIWLCKKSTVIFDPSQKYL